MPDVALSPVAITAIVLELGLVVYGLRALWVYVLSPAARAVPHPSRIPFWAVTWIDFLLFIWYVILCAFLIQTVAVLVIRRPDMDQVHLEIYAGLAFQIGLLAGCGAFRYLRPPRPELVFRGTDSEAPERFPFAAGALTFAIALPLVTLTNFGWNLLLDFAGVPTQEQDLVGIFVNADSPALVALLIIFASVVAPITEELVFRQGLFRFARQNLPRWAALLLPALLFAGLHQNLASFGPLVVLGLIFALAYERTGNIAVTMIAHGLFNLNTILLLYSGAAR